MIQFGVTYFLSPFIMESTLFLAKIMGVCFALIGLGMLFNLKFYMKAYEAFFKDTGLLYITGFFILIMGLLLVLVHNKWMQDWTMVVTILSWMTFVKGASIMLFPESIVKMKKTFLKKGWLTTSGVFILLLGLFLIYKGFELVLF